MTDKLLRRSRRKEMDFAGLDNRLFMSQYQLQLPTTDEIRTFVEKELAKEA